MLEPIPFAGMVEIDESFDRTASHMAGEYVSYNEPVAWMYEKSNGASKLSFVKEKMLWEDMTETPLYTHPVKTLTDGEILKMAADRFHYSEYKLVIEFARAILRKASEK